MLLFNSLNYLRKLVFDMKWWLLWPCDHEFNLSYPFLLNKKLNSTCQAKKARVESMIYTHIYHVLSRANSAIVKSKSWILSLTPDWLLSMLILVHLKPDYQLIAKQGYFNNIRAKAQKRSLSRLPTDLISIK